MDLQSQNMLSIFGEQGLLASALPYYHPRHSQLTLAESIDNAITDRQIFIAEAGTGTGKTFAYLAPALRSSDKTLVSTGTKNLQDQLFHKDLPIISKALNTSRRFALLKGRRNYLCRYRLQRFQEPQLSQREHLALWPLIQTWATRTQSGDIGEVSSVPEDAPVWQYATSTTDNCLGTECEEWRRCFVAAARRQAQEADLVVVNHHLFFADLALKTGGFGDLLPDSDTVIFDEAHQLADIATTYFGETLGSRQISELCSDLRMEILSRAADQYADVSRILTQLEIALRDTRGKLDIPSRTSTIQELLTHPQMRVAFATITTLLLELRDLSENLCKRSEGLEKCHLRAREFFTRWEKILVPEIGHAHFIETTRLGFTCKMLPLDIAPRFQSLVEGKKRAWIFTSATLSIAGDFSHFKRRLGLTEATELTLESPYDFAHNALLYVPRALPDPRESTYTAQLMQNIVPIIQANPGGTFVLFTSHRALAEGARILSELINRPLLVQGSSPRRVLLDEFRKAGNAVLLGSSSFWEGVDVQGHALSCVIIDKLPFAPPDDPLLRARINQAESQGCNAFSDVQLPLAILALRQGAGRLIRGDTDRGLLVIGDARLFEKSYGRIFLKALPPLPVTRDKTEALSFISSI